MQSKDLSTHGQFRKFLHVQWSDFVAKLKRIGEFQVQNIQLKDRTPKNQLGQSYQPKPESFGDQLGTPTMSSSQGGKIKQLMSSMEHMGTIHTIKPPTATTFTRNLQPKPTKMIQTQKVHTMQASTNPSLKPKTGGTNSKSGQISLAKTQKVAATKVTSKPQSSMLSTINKKQSGMVNISISKKKEISPCPSILTQSIQMDDKFSYSSVLQKKRSAQHVTRADPTQKLMSIKSSTTTKNQSKVKKHAEATPFSIGDSQLKLKENSIQVMEVETIKPDALTLPHKSRTPRSNTSSLIDEMNSFNETPAKIQILPQSKIQRTNTVRKSQTQQVEEVQLDYSPSQESEECQETQMNTSLTIHELLVDLIKKQKDQEIFRVIRDQKKLVEINQLVEGKGLLHHAAISNSLKIFQLIANLPYCDIQIKTKEGKTAYQLTKSQQIKSSIEQLVLKRGPKIQQQQRERSSSSDRHESFIQKQNELRQEIEAKLAQTGQQGRTRAQRMVQILHIQGNHFDPFANSPDSNPEIIQVPSQILAGPQSQQLSDQIGDVKSARNMERGEEVLSQSEFSNNDPEQIVVSLHSDDEFKRQRHLQVPHPETRILPQHFEPMQLLGTGSFAEVYLVRKKSSGVFYAMKVQSKDKIINDNLVKYAQTERNVLSYIEHPFIVNLNYAFQTEKKLYLIMEYCEGGDLSQVLKLERKFTESRAKIYAAEVLLAIQSLHKRDIIFRDLKPDNVVIDIQGHAKLTDFGLSKEGVQNDTEARSFCGSLAYLAPEMLNRSGHGKSVDWYLFGVLLYEMLVGDPPYFSDTQDEILNNIQHAVLKLPHFLSNSAKSLLTSLLNRNPSKRIGSGPRGAEEIKEHPFFSQINWEKVYNKEYKMPPPHIRNIKQSNPMAASILDDLGSFDDNRLPGWSFIHYGASEVVPSYQQSTKQHSSDKKKRGNKIQI